MGFWDKRAQERNINTPQNNRNTVWWQGPQVQVQQNSGAYGIPQATPRAPDSNTKLTPEEMAVLDASTAHATMVRSSKGQCPNCNGTNYAKIGQIFSQQGTFDNYQCYDCGWPVRHDGVPLNGISSTGRKMARQTDAGGGVIHNYHPQEIAAGRVSQEIVAGRVS